MLGYDNGHGPDVNPIFGGPDIAGLSHSIIDRQVVVTPEEILRAGQQALVPVRTTANDQDLASAQRKLRLVYLPCLASQRQQLANYMTRGSQGFGNERKDSK